MTGTLERRVVDPGQEAYLEATWELKERIRREEGALVQDRAFFAYQYRRSTVHLFLDDGAVVAFAVVQSDGYMVLLGVAPAYRRRGLATRLVGAIAENHDSVTCHTRVDNRDAIAFYTDRGFVVEERLPGYYTDGTDAYLLALDADDARALDRILSALG